MPPAPFKRLVSAAVPILEDNVDTDAILPARFLLMLDRSQASRGLFIDRRLDRDGARRTDFALDDPKFSGAKIIFSGANFGCGSSREAAPWALADNGFRCVIAGSFGEIFQANCIRNGLLPIALDAETRDRLQPIVEAATPLTVDLEACRITAEGMAPVAFSVDPAARAALLNGWDETSTILALYADDITAFEQGQSRVMPWLYDEQLLASALQRAAASAPTPPL